MLRGRTGYCLGMYRFLGHLETYVLRLFFLVVLDDMVELRLLLGHLGTGSFDSLCMRSSPLCKLSGLFSL